MVTVMTIQIATIIYTESYSSVSTNIDEQTTATVDTKNTLQIAIPISLECDKIGKVEFRICQKMKVPIKRRTPL